MNHMPRRSLQHRRGKTSIVSELNLNLPPTLRQNSELYLNLPPFTSETHLKPPPLDWPIRVDQNVFPESRNPSLFPPGAPGVSGPGSRQYPLDRAGKLHHNRYRLFGTPQLQPAAVENQSCARTHAELGLGQAIRGKSIILSESGPKRKRGEALVQVYRLHIVSNTN